MTPRQTQCARILTLLQHHAGEWVPLPRILDLRIACHSKRLSDLRREGWIIELNDVRFGKERHTMYRLLGKLSDQVQA